MNTPEIAFRMFAGTMIVVVGIRVLYAVAMSTEIGDNKIWGVLVVAAVMSVGVLIFFTGLYDYLI